MTKVLDVNMDAVVVFSNKLEKLNKTAFPKAVATALNSAAFDVKQNTMLKSSKKAFVERQRNFFRANSRVEMAKGMNVNNMQSIVGFRDLGGKNFAVDDLEQQEKGGNIKGKSLIPLGAKATPAHAARTSKKFTKKVAKQHRMGSIRRVVNTNKMKGNTRQKLVKAAHVAGAGNHVLHGGILFRVNSLVGRKGLPVKLTPLYSYKPGRSVKVHATHFMSKASMESGKKIEDFYIKAAKTQFNKALK